MQRRLRALFFSCAAALVLIPGAQAQVLDVPGDHPTVQAAIDAASPGATVRVHGGTWGSITITKPLTLIGPALFEGNASGTEWSAPILLSGTGTGTVVLSDVSTGKEFVNGNQFYEVSPGIAGGGFGELHVYDSLIRAPSFCSFSGGPGCLLSGVGLGEPGINVNVPVIVLERSLVQGSRSDNDGGSGYPDGPAGIDAPASTVLAFDTTIRGGPSGNYNAYPYGSCEGLCFGSGGPAVVAEVLYRSNSVLTGGAGATWHGRESENEPYVVCPCTGPSGAPWVVSVQSVDLRSTLNMPVPPQLGTDLTLLHRGASGAKLLVTLDLGLPTKFPPTRGLFFLHGSPSLVGTIGNGTVLVSIPATPSLIGAEVAFQTIEPGVGFAPPVAGVIR
jgi:hypothetical protein